MKIYWFLFTALMIVFVGCDEDEEQLVCSCSTHDEYYHVSATDTEWVYIPNIFTPNSNRVDDRFAIIGFPITSLSIRINDGNSTVFQTNALNGSWDGTVNGSKYLGCRNYNYIIDIVFNSGTMKHFEGEITMVSDHTSCPDNYSNCKFGSHFSPIIPGFNPNLSSTEFTGC